MPALADSPAAGLAAGPTTGAAGPGSAPDRVRSGESPRSGESVRPRVIRPSLTAEDLTELFGPIPLARIVWDPTPGTATFADCVRLNESGRLCELIDGILLEKAVGWTESEIAMRLGIRVGFWDPDEGRGRRTGADGFTRLVTGRVRGPDFSFYKHARFPNPSARVAPIPDLTPDFCVEILSASNTRREIYGKLDDLFASGCRLAWVIDPAARTARIVTPAEPAGAESTGTDDEGERPWTDRTVGAEAILSGDPVLPGFSVRLDELLAIPAPPPAAPPPGATDESPAARTGD